MWVDWLAFLFLFQARNCIADECYFTDSDLLGRVPGLLLTLAAIYFVMGMTGLATDTLLFLS